MLTFREIDYKDVNRIEPVHIGILPVYVSRELMVNVDEETSRNSDVLNEPSQCY